MQQLPLNINLDTIETLKLLVEANNKIGELKGIVNQLPNPQILLNAITLGEAKDSSEIENIITTYDDLYKEMTSAKDISIVAKEVLRYHKAISIGWNEVINNGFISTNIIKKIHNELEPNKGSIRKLPGTIIKNINTGETIFTPPQTENEILDYLSNLEYYLNNENEYDSLINMAIIHYQFEIIHPFYDGNGRTGRIINVLYLVLKGKLDYPILYLSKYINDNRQEYYQLLKKCNNDINEIHSFIQYMLKAVKEMSIFTIDFITTIVSSMDKMTSEMKKELPKIYSKELVEYLYSHFYTKIDFLKDEFNITRQTASSYLKQLEEKGFLVSEKVGKEIIYKNIALLDLMNKW